MFETGRSRLLLAAVIAVTTFPLFAAEPANADKEVLLAGAAKVDVTNADTLSPKDRLFARAIVLRKGTTTAVIVGIDVVAIGEIGPIGNDFLGKVRSRIQTELGIDPANVLVNASHCHGIVCSDVDEKTFQAVQMAANNLVPVRVGSGVGKENRVSENRRLKLKSGKEADVRHAYSLPPDEEVAEVGPIDPEIGLLKLDKYDGQTLAVLYNFACHPIMGIPSGENTGDITGYASQVIEDNLSEGAIALFVQGCAGDINPVLYKDVNNPRHAEPLGNQLGLSVLKGLKSIECVPSSRFKVSNEILPLPRADLAEKILMLEGEQLRLLGSLRGTSLNLKTFVPLIVKYNLSTEFPSYYSHRYLQEEKIGRSDLSHHDAANRRNIEQYINNIHIMEQLTRNQTNLALLKKHQEANLQAGRKPLEVEVAGLRVGDFILVTFPGELTVEIGLGIKERSPHEHTFVAGYTNGYIYYTPTAQQLRNVGGAQEDSDCRLAPEWQKIFEKKVAEVLSKL